MTPALNVDDPLKAIAQLQQEKQLLLTVLTDLHRDICEQNAKQNDRTYLALMGSMSQARTLIRRLGGDA